MKVDLIAADADIGAAIADRFPRITINSSYMYSDTASLVVRWLCLWALLFAILCIRFFL
tara:strand:+ start:283 stop:459 length:177 start_codon:yes stop_codon:yes gene_type:complete